MDLIHLLMAVAALIIAWVLVERFSPDATLTLIVKIVIFVAAVYLALTLVGSAVGFRL